MSAATKSPPLIRLMHYARAYRGRALTATLFTVLNQVMDLAPPVLMGVAVDIVVQRENSWLAQLGVADLRMQLYALAILTVVIWFLESLFEYLYEIRWRNLAQSVEHDLRQEAYQHVQGLEMAYFEDSSTGGLMSVLNDDINQLERFLDRGAAQVIQVFLIITIIGGFFLALAPGIAWFSLIPIPIIVWGSVRFQDLLAPHYRRVREQVSVINAILSNNLSGIATIKSFTAESHEAARLEAASEEYRRRNRGAIQLSSAFIPLIRMVIMAGFIAITVFGGFMALDGRLDVAAYSTMVYMTQRLLWPLTRLGETFDQYQRAMASTTRILDLLDTHPRIKDGQQRLPIEQVRGALRFEGVSFAYGDGIPVLKSLDLELPAGQTVGVVGLTGAGKTTLVKLLLRFYDVLGGRVTLDGMDLRDLHLSDLRAAIGLVSQDVFLFDGSILDNIRYGSFGATMAQTVEAARIAEVHEFISSLPDGYQTQIGERGQKLSGGQRQRLSIARAVLKNPPVLVLDEATSSVDNETEAAIQRSLDRITRDRTTIMIAHRLSTLRHADRIYVMQEGGVAEAGTHESLLSADGIYAGLWRVQTGERIGAK